MEEPPLKRQKTSTDTMADLTVPRTPTRSASHDGNPLRASFMSPTKASLARFNPHLLPPLVLVEQNPRRSSRSQSIGNEQRPESNVGRKMVTGSPIALSQKPEHGKMMIEPKGMPEESVLVFSGATARVAGNELHTPPRGILHVPTTVPLGAETIQLATSQDPRAPPPQATDNEAQPILEAFKDQLEVPQETILHHMNQRMQGSRDNMDHADQQEPVLSPTPTNKSTDSVMPRLSSTPSQLGLEAQPSPPKGPLFDSPSRRPQRRKQTEPHFSSKPRAPITVSKDIEKSSSSTFGPRILVVHTKLHLQAQAAGRNHIKNKVAAPGSTLTIKAQPKPLSLADRLALFLPFSKPPASEIDPTKSGPPIRDHTNPNAPGALGISIIESLSSDDSRNNLILQHQKITITSPQEFLTVQFQLIVDKNTQKNTSLIISDISPWADKELGQWLRREAVNLDRSITEKTISHYWKLSRSRALCWQRCEQELKPNSSTNNASPATNKELQESAPSSTQQSPGSPQTIATPKSSSNRSSSTTNATIPTPAPLTSHHFYPSILLSRKNPSTTTTTSLLTTWRLAISPAGALHSQLSAHATFPESWTAGGGDGSAALGKVAEMFEPLVGEVGVFEAVRRVWEVVGGERGGEKESGKGKGGKDMEVNE